jgi:hypothetical protein
MNLSSGIKAQVLSPGRINPHEGPDFRDVALLINGKIIIGDAEFHHNSSLWFDHKHSEDSNYKNVILHIVLNDDSPNKLPFETLIVPEKEITAIYKEQIAAQQHKPDIFSLEELQNFSLIRLLRHTTEIQKLINQFGLETAVLKSTEEFLARFIAKKRRPSYNYEKVHELPEEIVRSASMSFVRQITRHETNSIPDRIVSLMKTKISNEGAGLRREIILNVVLPAALTQADEEARINLFVWYWSVPALNKYGVLTRRFPELPQNYLWQQQGMLEYMREIETSSSTISDALHFYGIGNLLSFFQWGPTDNY